MKVTALCFFALLLLIPSPGNADSVSSRYDVTFGGFVKYDLGWSSQNTHADPTAAARQSSSEEKVLVDEYSNTFATAAQTRFNFLIKGPDLWRASTSAFIEGDFRGVSTGNKYGGFQLRHAFMTLKWPSVELLIGQNWQQWGMPYYSAPVGNNDFVQYLKGIRVPQMTLRYFFTKEFNAMFGVSSATRWSGNTRQYNDGYARSNWPGLTGEIAYFSDRLGKIGPNNNLRLALGAYYGRDTEISNPSTYVIDTRYHDATINAWIAAFRYSIPIIPEKQGDKAMSLLLNGNFFIGQNAAGNDWLSPRSNGAYWRNTTTTDLAAPTLFGLYAQLSFWFTDALWINGMYGYLKYNYSEYARDNNEDNVNMSQTCAVNLMWDANRAIRFGLQWMTMFTGYNRANPVSGSTGTGEAGRTGQIDQYRFTAWYFF